MVADEKSETFLNVKKFKISPHLEKFQISHHLPSSVKIHNVGKKSLGIAAAPVYRHKSSHCKVPFYWCDTSSLSFLLVEEVRHCVSIYPVKATVCHPLLPVSPNSYSQLSL